MRNAAARADRPAGPYNPRMSVELLCPQWIAPVAPGHVVLTDHAVVVEGQRIAALLPADEARRRWPDGRVTELPGQLIIPGLVNLHCHAAMTLLRGVGDDLPLHDWLHKRIWPLEKALLGPQFVFDGSILAIQEMLRGGITCFADMYFHPDQTARAAQALGIRAALGIVVLEFPTSWGTGPADYLRKGLELRDRLRDDPAIRFTLAPHAPYSVSDDTFRRIASLAAEIGLPIHCHVHETAQEVQDSVREHGLRPLQRLERLGVVGPELIAVHAVHLDPRDIDTLARLGAHVAHCPHSNLKLASGLCPAGALLDAGVNVGIGTDGAASNNRLDLIGETRTATLLAKGLSGAADAWPAHQALHAATLGGAQALGWAHDIGSIEPGKLADLVAVDLRDPDFQPLSDPVSQLFHCADRTCVSHVWIGGHLVVFRRQLTDPSGASLVSEVVARSRLWHNQTGEMIG